MWPRAGISPSPLQQPSDLSPHMRHNSYPTSITLYPTVTDSNNARNTRFSFLYATCPTYHGGIFDCWPQLVGMERNHLIASDRISCNGTSCGCT